MVAVAVAAAALTGVTSAGADSAAVIDQIRAVDRSRFVSRAGKLSANDIRELEMAFKRVLALP